MESQSQPQPQQDQSTQQPAPIDPVAEQLIRLQESYFADQDKE